MRLSHWLGALGAALLAGVAQPVAAAVALSSWPVDIADSGPGDRWRVLYQLDSFPYGAGYGVTVFFDPDLYESLVADSPAPHPDWDAITSEPDANLGADGLYDAEALTDTPATSVVFSVTFDWLGQGTPGPQPFEIREPGPGFATVESRVTVVPEPGTAALPASALLALGALGAPRRSRC